MRPTPGSLHSIWAGWPVITAVLLLSLVPAQAPSAEAAVPMASPNVITVDPGVTFQTITAWEATAQAGQETSPAYANYSARVIDLALLDLGINRLRVEVRAGVENPDDYWGMYVSGQVDYAFWRSHRYTTVNDDADPGSINWSGFHFTELDSTVEKLVLPMLRRAEALGLELLINVNYVAFTGQNGAGLPYIHNDPAEYAELVLATYVHLDTEYGIVPDYWEVILEPDNVAQWNGGTIGRAMVATQTLLAAHNYTVRFIAPSNTNMGGAITYFDAMAAVPGALGNLSELSYHRYGGVSDANLRAIAARRDLRGVDTAMLEHIGSGYADLHKDLVIANASSWQQFTLASPTTSDGGGAYLLVDASDPAHPVVLNASRTKFLRQYFSYVRSGAVRIGAASNNATFEPVAFVNPDGRPVVVVKANSAGDVSVAGLPAGTYGVSYTTSARYDVHLTDVTIAQGGTVDAAIPATGALTISAQNLAPRVVSRSPDHDVVMGEGGTADFAITVDDDDLAGSAYEWSLDGAIGPAWTGPAFSYSPDYGSAGEHKVVVNVTDGGSPRLSVSVEWNVTVLDVNRPPVIGLASPTSPLVLNETVDGNVTFTVDASDPDGDPLVYAWYLGTGLLVNETGTNYTMRFDHGSAGVYDVRVVVNDTRAEATAQWRLAILDVNRPPVVLSYRPALDVRVDESPTGALALFVEATDPDGDPLGYDWFVDGAGPVASGCATYSFGHGHDSAGDHDVVVIVTDGNATVTVAWAVHVANVNRPPVITSRSPASEMWVDEGEGGAQELSVTVSDPDSDALGYAWTVDGRVLPGPDAPGFTFEFNFTSAGDHHITVTVRDASDAVSWSWTIHVRNVDRPPVILSHEPLSVGPVRPGVPVNLSVRAQDPDADAPSLVYEWYVNGTLVANVTGPVMAFVAMPGEAGNRTVRVRVLDAEGAWTELGWNLTVVEPPPDGNGDGGGDGGDGDENDTPRSTMWIALALVAVVVIAGFLAALRQAGKDRQGP